MPEDTTLFEIGELVAGAYEIRGVLGEGGMGRVYGAHDVVLNRKVAIKASWPSIEATFLQKEAQALASVRHPGMIDVYGAGTHRGIPYLVMEHLYGVNLESFLEKRHGDSSPLGVAEVLDVLLPVADALAAVHRSGITHRDVKPGNVMLTPNGRIVIMDFGLFESEGEKNPILSGTPEYMAPELLLRTVEPRDAFLVDVYALGITAYELLSGVVPFEGPTPTATITLHLTGQARDLRELRPDVPARLAALVHEMIAKDPLERPPSMEAVGFRLRAAREAANAPARSHEKFTVLVVDDDAALGKLVGMYVTRAVPEAVVTAVQDAERALVAVREKPPDVMLVDLHMPRMNGIELCMMLRGMHLADRCTIVAVSAGARDADLDLLRQLGITRFVPKGAELGALLSAQLKELYRGFQRASADESPSVRPPPPTPAAASSVKLHAAREIQASHRWLAGAGADQPLVLAIRDLARRLPSSAVVLFDRELNAILSEGGALAALGRDAELVPERRALYEAALAGASGEADLVVAGRRFRLHVVPVRDDGGVIACGMAITSEV